jgi:hypothetical protein
MRLRATATLAPAGGHRKSLKLSFDFLLLAMFCRFEGSSYDSSQMDD